jgi:hypothetical protein
MNRHQSSSKPIFDFRPKKRQIIFHVPPLCFMSVVNNSNKMVPFLQLLHTFLFFCSFNFSLQKNLDLSVQFLFRIGNQSLRQQASLVCESSGRQLSNENEMKMCQIYIHNTYSIVWLGVATFSINPWNNTCDYIVKKSCLLLNAIV